MKLFTNKKFTLGRGSLNDRALTGLLLVLSVVALLWGSTANAQLAGKGEIKGTVTDSTGAVVPGATVTATSTTTGTKFTRTTSASGEFDLTPLNNDIYSVTTTAKGFQTLTQQNVHVNALEVADVHVSLAVGSETETVDAPAPPQLETSNATLGATMENDMYSALPIEMGAYGQPDQRRATDFAFLMPGVQGNNTTGNATTNTGIVNGSGSRGAVSAVYVDGLPFVRAGGNGDPRYVWTAISVDAVDQFQVQTSGYSAIYEGQGIQNYTVKRAATSTTASSTSSSATPPSTPGASSDRFRNPVTGKPVKPIEHSNEYGINLSGPLIPFGKWREKIFFFGNYNGFRYCSADPDSNDLPHAGAAAGRLPARHRRHL